MRHYDAAYMFAHVSSVIDSCLYSLNEPVISEMVNNSGLIQGTPGFLVNETTPIWYFYLLMTLIVGYAVAKTFLGQLITSTFMATVRYNIAEGMYKDNSQLQRQRDNALYGFYFVTTGLFFMLLSDRMELEPFGLSGFRLFLFYSVLLMALFFARILITIIVGHVFLIHELLRENLYMEFTYNKLLGILLLPLNFIIVYSEEILAKWTFYIALFIIIVLVFMKMARGVVFSTKKRVFNFYLFLYLCALEIVPLLLFYKWFTTVV